MSLVSIVVVIIISALLCWHAKLVGKFLNVIDYPDNTSKLHVAPTPAVGGICILVPVTLTILATVAIGAPSVDKLPVAVGLCALGIGTVGLMDDQSAITPLSRVLSILIFLAVVLVIDPELASPVLTWNGSQQVEIPLYVYWAVLAVASVGILNAVNMADGQNGLVPGMFVIWTACLLLIADDVIAPIAALLLAACAVAFAFNLRGKLFLGSCGSYGVTFMICVLLAAQHARRGISVETVITYFAIPMLDCLRLLVTRLLYKRRPSSRDNNHIHHHLQNAFGWQSSLIAYLGVVGAASLVATLYPRWALVCALASAALYFGFIIVYLWKRPLLQWVYEANIAGSDWTADMSFPNHSNLLVVGNSKLALARSHNSRPAENSGLNTGGLGPVDNVG